MGMTMVEKILAAHAGKDTVSPGDLVNVKLDIVLGNDITAPVAIKEFKKIGVAHVFDKAKVALVPDHFLPAKDIASAEQAKILRDFAAEQQLENYFEIGKMGIEHVILPEQGVVLPGDAIIGADSHTCTYGALGAFATGVGSTDLAAAMATGEVWLKVPHTIKFNINGTLQPWVSAKDVVLYIIGMIGVDGALYHSMEYHGSTISDLSMEGRLTIANMAIEAGAKCGIFPVDEKTLEYVKGRAKREYTVYEADADAQYHQVIDIDASQIEPQVAYPHLPSNTHGVSESKSIKIDQSVIGSCTNGRIEDLEVAAGVLKGHTVAHNMRLIVIPGSQEVYLEAMRRGYVETFIEAGGIVSTPTCGPCLGGHMGILAAGERAISTTNRNFKGRMGHVDSEVYLANPAVAAASAVAGHIASPDDL